MSKNSETDSTSATIEESISPVITTQPSTNTPLGTLIPKPLNCTQLWENTFTNIGTMANYPRPQGNLPAFTWQLTPNAQVVLGNLYKSI